jgi:phenylalanyl-tRNA synthetase beta chain
MQERLLRHGMRPINNVVDITNYVMLETGQPLHAFDYDLVRGRRIIVRNAHPGERLVTLDGVERELAGYMGVVCDGEGPSSIAGIMGGSISEVSEATVNVLLEVANWRPGAIRKTSTHLHLRSEASARFEKGIGPEMAMYAQERALHLFEQLTGGRIATGIIDVYPGRQPPRSIIVPPGRIERVLGIDVPRADVERILRGLGFDVSFDGTAYTVGVPFWRPDVEIPDDVVEDIGRIYGYDRLPATRLRGTLPEVTPRPIETMRERLRDAMAGLGFDEVITYSLVDRRTLELVTGDGDERRRSPLSVANPVAAQHAVLRTTLRGSLLETFAANRRHDDGLLRLFEIAVEFLPTEADLPHERPVLCAVAGGRRPDRWARPAGDEFDFFDAKGTVEALLEAVRIRAGYAPAEHHGLLPGHTAVISAGGVDVGVVARVHPEVAIAFRIEEPVFLIELWLEDLAGCLPERPDYAPPPRFPEVRQDIAIVVDGALPAGRVLEVVRSHRSRGISISGHVFDEYRGPGIPEDKKSLAIRLHFQAPDRTLTDAEVANVQQGLVARLNREFGATLRA